MTKERKRYRLELVKHLQNLNKLKQQKIFFAMFSMKNRTELEELNLKKTSSTKKHTERNLMFRPLMEDEV